MRERCIQHFFDNDIDPLDADSARNPWDIAR
jgi:hypothetical protein